MSNDHQMASAEIENDLNIEAAEMDEAEYYEDFESVFCPMCSGESGILGVLGSLTWYQCRYCGMEFNRR